MAAVLGERNAEDSRRKAEVNRAGKRRAFERGDFPGGPVPDGFAVIGKKDEPRFCLDPARIEIIRLIGELADQGWGSVPPSPASSIGAGHRTSWCWLVTSVKQRVHDLLTNAIYYGGRHSGTEGARMRRSTGNCTLVTRTTSAGRPISQRKRADRNSRGVHAGDRTIQPRARRTCDVRRVLARAPL